MADLMMQRGWFGFLQINTRIQRISLTKLRDFPQRNVTRLGFCNLLYLQQSAPKISNLADTKLISQLKANYAGEGGRKQAGELTNVDLYQFSQIYSQGHC